MSCTFMLNEYVQEDISREILKIEIRRIDGGIESFDWD